MSTHAFEVIEHRSADGIQFEGRYERYRNECLRLVGLKYYQLKTCINDQWHPFRLPGVKKY